MAVIITVSITHDQKAYLKEKKLSASLIMQQRIDELRGLNPVCTLTELQSWKEKVYLLTKRLSQVTEFLENRGVIDEFLEIERKKDNE